MAKRLPLIPSDDPILRKVAKKIPKPESVAALAADLLMTMQEEGGVGLAAPQTGQSVRMIVTAAGGGKQVFINPEITQRSRKQVVLEEGCLSLPRLFGDVKRPERITFRAQNLDGETLEVKADDFLARVIQHEVDHLNGILFTDHIKDLTTLRTISQAEWDERLHGNQKLKNEEL